MALHHSIETDESTIPAALRRFLTKRAFEVSGLILLAVIIGIGLALASWSPADPSLNHATGGKALNWLGYPGAVIADQLMQLLGFGVLAFLLIPLSWVIRFFRHESPENPKKIVLCWLAATLSLSCLLATFPTIGNWSLASGFGGNFGDVVSGGLLSLLSIGIKGFVANSMIFVLASFATYCTATRALNVTSIKYFERAPSRVKSDRKMPKLEPQKSWGDQFAGAWASISQIIPKRQEKPKLPANKNRISTGDDVIGRFAPLNLAKAPRARLEPSFEEEPQIDAEPEALFENEIEFQNTIEEEIPEAKSVVRTAAKPKLKSKQPRFELPSLELLSEPKKAGRLPEFSPEFLEENARRLEGVLEDFGVRGQIINVRPGPVVTLYELEPAPGIKSSRVISLADDIARSMSAISARVAVVAGRNAIGIELPNPKTGNCLSTRIDAN
jgi:DNA segregation ATPase FtsK/SpoIIIE, S-DNA-T family